MKTLVFLLAISRLTTSSVLPYHGVTVGITPYSVPVHSQYFHNQDHLGQYVYGYASHGHAKDEIKTADGITRGGYSYIDANGILQTVQYISDPVNGFRVSASNIPRDLPEVAWAKAQHFQNYHNIKAQHAYIAAQQKNLHVAVSPLPVQGSLVAPIHAANIIPVPVVTTKVEPIPYVPQTVHHISIPVSSQYHAQDNHGQYSYGYAGPLSSKSETKTADGITQGGYSYIDANGILQSVRYISDPVNGFRVKATNLPEAPVVTLIGPKVTTSVVGPKDQNSVVSAGIGSIPVNPVASSEIHTIPVVNPPVPVEFNPGYVPSDRFVYPVILSDSIKGGQPILTRPSVLNQAEHSIISNGNNPVLTQPPALTNPIHSIPFSSNGRIVTHDNLNIADSVANDNLNIPSREVIVQNANIQDGIAYHGQQVLGPEQSYDSLSAQANLPANSAILHPNNQNFNHAHNYETVSLQHPAPGQNYGNLPPQVIASSNSPVLHPSGQNYDTIPILNPIHNGGHSQYDYGSPDPQIVLEHNSQPILTSDGHGNRYEPISPQISLPQNANNSAVSGQREINLVPESIQGAHQPISPFQINVPSQLFGPSQGESIPADPNYQIPINPGPGDGSEVIRKDQIDSRVINRYPTVNQGYFAPNEGSIAGPALYAGRQEHVQQVSQTPVNGVGTQAQHSPAPLNHRDNVVQGNGYEIRGPDNNPNVQPSGYYTQNIEY